MKRIISSILSGIIVLVFSSVSYAQKPNSKFETIEFEVKGVCDMCKMRIENASYIKGVKFSEWDKETATLKLVYNPKKVKLNDVHQSLADSGHSTSKIKATSEAYKKLPNCCAYDSGVEKH